MKTNILKFSNILSMKQLCYNLCVPLCKILYTKWNVKVVAMSQESSQSTGAHAISELGGGRAAEALLLLQHHPLHTLSYPKQALSPKVPEKTSARIMQWPQFLPCPRLQNYSILPSFTFSKNQQVIQPQTALLRVKIRSVPPSTLDSLTSTGSQ